MKETVLKLTDTGFYVIVNYERSTSPKNLRSAVMGHAGWAEHKVILDNLYDRIVNVLSEAAYAI